MKTILIDAVGCFISSEGKIFSEMHFLLDTYPNKKIILTGANDEQYRKFGLDKMPYDVFTLKHDPEKTNPSYFKKMLTYFGLSNDDVIYFEHNQEVVQCAKSFGITSWFYDNERKDLVALKAFLDANLKELHK